MILLILTGSASAADRGFFARWVHQVLPERLEGSFLGLETWQWVYLVLLLIVARLLAWLVRLILQGQVERSLHRMGLPVDPEVWQPTKAPLVWLVLIGVVTAGLPDLGLQTRLADALIRTANVALWVVGTVTLQRFVIASGISSRTFAARTDSKLDDQAIPLLTQAARLVVLVLGGLYAADAAGLDVWKLAAGVGLGGLALALAAQDTVANLFGSVNIFFDRPFQIGDWVKIGDVEGTVEEVGFRSTRVRTGHGSLVSLPNSKITGSNIDNYGQRPRKKAEAVVGFAIGTPTERVLAFVDALRAQLDADPAIAPGPEVHLDDVNGALRVRVGYLVVDAQREHDVRQAHLVGALELAARLGLSPK